MRKSLPVLTRVSPTYIMDSVNEQIGLCDKSRITFPKVAPWHLWYVIAKPGTMSTVSFVVTERAGIVNPRKVNGPRVTFLFLSLDDVLELDFKDADFLLVVFLFALAVFL